MIIFIQSLTWAKFRHWFCFSRFGSDMFSNPCIDHSFFVVVAFCVFSLETGGGWGADPATGPHGQPDSHDAGHHGPKPVLLQCQTDDREGPEAPEEKRSPYTLKNPPLPHAPVRFEPGEKTNQRENEERRVDSVGVQNNTFSQPISHSHVVQTLEFYWDHSQCEESSGSAVVKGILIFHPNGCWEDLVGECVCGKGWRWGSCGPDKVWGVKSTTICLWSGWARASVVAKVHACRMPSILFWAKKDKEMLN